MCSTTLKEEEEAKKFEAFVFLVKETSVDEFLKLKLNFT
jgi:hypothetical protein